MPVKSRSSSAASAGQAASAARGCSSLKVRRLSRRLSQHFDRIVAVTGLKTTQYSLLCHVVDLGLTRNLQPLVAAGWVVLGPGDDDRSRAVSATGAGRAKRLEAQRSWKRAQLAFNDRVGIDLVARLHAVVDECLAQLDSAPAAE